MVRSGSAVERLLREVTHRQTGSETHVPESGVTAPATIFNSVDFPRAVLSHDAPAFAAADVQIQAVVNHAPAECFADVFKRDNLIPDRGGCRKSNFTTRRFFGSSIFSILSSAFTRL